MDLIGLRRRTEEMEGKRLALSALETYVKSENRQA
jgi:hypothetical protein